MPLEILQIGHPDLRLRSQELTREMLASDDMQLFIDDLIATMQAAQGAGIAAIQVGRPLRIFVLDMGDNPRYPFLPSMPLRVLVNPEIEVLSDKRALSYDGCLSVPGLRGPVERPLEIRVRAWDRYGANFDASYFGFCAAVLCHEYDHLNGELFVDHVEHNKELCTWDMFQTYHQELEAVKWANISEQYEQLELIH